MPKELPDALKKNLWKPGQSGNPKGKPKGSRIKFNDAFLADMLEAWESMGMTAIVQMAKGKPNEYVRASLDLFKAINPKEITVKNDGSITGRFNEDELDSLLALADRLETMEGGASTGKADPSGEGQPKPIH